MLQNKCQKWPSLISKPLHQLYIGASKHHLKTLKGIVYKNTGKLNEVRKSCDESGLSRDIINQSDNRLVIQSKYHRQVRNPSPNIFGQHLSSVQTLLEVQENHCILLRLFPVCLHLPSPVLA